MDPGTQSSLLKKSIGSDLRYSVPGHVIYDTKIHQADPSWSNREMIVPPMNPQSGGYRPGDEIRYYLPKESLYNLEGFMKFTLEVDSVTPAVPGVTNPILTLTPTPNPLSGLWVLHFTNPFTKIGCSVSFEWDDDAATQKANVEALPNWPTGWTLTSSGLLSAGAITWTISGMGKNAAVLNGGAHGKFFSFSINGLKGAADVVTAIILTLGTPGVAATTVEIPFLGPQTIWRDVQVKLGDGKKAKYTHFEWSKEKFITWALTHQRTRQEGLKEDVNRTLWFFDSDNDYRTATEVFLPIGLIEFGDWIIPGPLIKKSQGFQELIFTLDAANKIFSTANGAVTAVNYKVTNPELRFPVFDSVPMNIQMQLMQGGQNFFFNYFQSTVSVQNNVSTFEVELPFHSHDIEGIFAWGRDTTESTNLQSFTKNIATSGTGNVTAHYVKFNGLPYPTNKIVGQKQALIEFLRMFHQFTSIGALEEAGVGFSLKDFTPGGISHFLVVNLKKVHDADILSGWNTSDTNKSFQFVVECSAPSTIEWTIFALTSAIVSIKPDGSVEFTK